MPNGGCFNTLENTAIGFGQDPAYFKGFLESSAGMLSSRRFNRTVLMFKNVIDLMCLVV